MNRVLDQLIPIKPPPILTEVFSLNPDQSILLFSKKTAKLMPSI